MLTPEKMIYLELSVFKSDIDIVLEYLGRKGALHFPDTESLGDKSRISCIRNYIDKLRSAIVYTGNDLKSIESISEDEVAIPGENEELRTNDICYLIENLRSKQIKAEQEKQRVQEALHEVQAFSKLNVKFSELDQLSYLTLRVGKLDLKGQAELRHNLKDRAIIISLDKESLGADEPMRILAATSRKGRFTLDSHLKKVAFEPISFPKDLKGIPSEMAGGLEEKLKNCEDELNEINIEKEKLKINLERDYRKLLPAWKMALTMEEIKSTFTTTENLYHFSGWTPAELASEVSGELLEITGNRAAIKTYSPNEVPSVVNGKQKIPVFVKHGAFVKGFEGVVFSYGSPLYGTIDPTPIVAFFFTLLFGIMFGDVGQGFVLFLAGILIKYGPKKLKGFSKFGTPLVSIGISSMIFGFLFGAVFSHENMLIGITRKLSGFITGNPVDRFIPVMPLAESGGSLIKLMYFFGFTLAIGAIIISIGLILNIINHIILKKYEIAFFSKSGVAGLFLFWYAIFIAVHVLAGYPFIKVDMVFLITPVVMIFFGPLIWRIIARKKPVLEHGLMTFIMEGFVEILETVSGYISNTVSFLRVGAFALSHTVLSFIVFTFAELVAHGGGAGTVGAGFIFIFGNVIIIVLEGMIVAIQVMRLQYYEFFNKFFVETGVEFSPFRFKKKA